jgi:hypothetical protein
MMAGAGRELAVTHGAQVPAHRLLGDPHPELFPDPLAEIDETPAHHPMDGRYRTAFTLRSQRLTMGIGQDRPRARGFAVKQAFRPFGVEPHHPSNVYV